jgi:hypothetical protein
MEHEVASYALMAKTVFSSMHVISAPQSKEDLVFLCVAGGVYGIYCMTEVYQLSHGNSCMLTGHENTAKARLQNGVTI